MFAIPGSAASPPSLDAHTQTHQSSLNEGETGEDYVTHIVNPHALRVDLLKSFGGWHFSVTRGVISKTALAVVPLLEDTQHTTHQATKALNEAIQMQRVVNVASPTTMIEKCARFLHNDGSTLQVSAGTMILLRPFRALVRGSKKTHIACPCNVKNYYVLTEAFLVASAYVAQLLTTRATHKQQSTQQNTLRLFLLHNSDAVKNETTCTGIFALLKKKNKHIETDSIAASIHAASILYTSFNDAGMNFRDRSSKAEAGRKLGESIAAALATKVFVSD